MNTSVINVSNSNAGTAAIVHVPQHNQSRQVRAQRSPAQRGPLRQGSMDNREGMSASTVDIRDEVVDRFRRYYQRFVGYPMVDFQPPANTTVQYSMLQHTGTHLWETPTFKAGVAGFGGVITTLSVGFLLSDSAPSPVVADPLNYTLPADTANIIDANEGIDAVRPIALDTSQITLSDRPDPLDIIEFSQTTDVPIISTDMPIISLEPLETRRFDVQLHDIASVETATVETATVETESSEVEPVEPQAVELASIAPISVEPTAPVAAASIPSEPELEFKPIEPIESGQHLSDDDVTNISAGFAAPLESAPDELVTDELVTDELVTDELAPDNSILVESMPVESGQEIEIEAYSTPSDPTNEVQQLTHLEKQPPMVDHPASQNLAAG
ncbi:MAG: hypothetical protein AAGA75_05985 [Cyanobacteria bacterium P01_E01_bin.6]